MSIVPRDSFSSGNDQSLSNLWDGFFANHDALFSNYPFSLPSLPSSSRSVPYSELAMESEGPIATRLECREIEEALIFVADLPGGAGKDDVKVEVEEGGDVLRITGGGGGEGGGGRFSWRFRLPGDAKLQLLSSSVENGVLTVIVPKVEVWGMRWAPPRNVRVVEIVGSD